MKKILSLLLIACMAGSFVSCNKKGGAKSTPLSDSVSESMGNLYGSGMASQFQADSASKDKKASFMRGFELIVNANTTDDEYLQGIQAGMQVMQMFQGVQEQSGITLNKKKFIENFRKAFNADSVPSQEALQALQAQIMPMLERASAEAKANDPVAQKNLKDGQAYLAKQLSSDKSYQKTASGTIYKVLAQGNGKTFKKNDVVMVKYKGTHIDGKVFDESGDEARPMPIDGVIPGFAEILQLMSPGAKVHCVIPAEAAYGSNGTGAIGPNETLVFDIEAVQLQNQSKPAQEQLNGKPVEGAPVNK